MKNRIFLLLTIIITLTGCIKDDIVLDDVPPELRFFTCLDSLKIDSSYQMDVRYFNYVGQLEEVDLEWSTNNAPVLTVNEEGVIFSHDYGMAYVKVRYNELIDSVKVNIGNTTLIAPKVKSGKIRTTSSYLLEGDFEIRQQGADLVIDVASNYKASSALPGLYIYLTNNNATTVGALEIGPVEVFSGTHTYTVSDVNINEYAFLLYYCKPFNVKVGDGQIQ